MSDSEQQQTSSNQRKKEQSLFTQLKPGGVPPRRSSNSDSSLSQDEGVRDSSLQDLMRKQPNIISSSRSVTSGGGNNRKSLPKGDVLELQDLSSMKNATATINRFTVQDNNREEEDQLIQSPFKRVVVTNNSKNSDMVGQEFRSSSSFKMSDRVLDNSPDVNKIKVPNRYPARIEEEEKTIEKGFNDTPFSAAFPITKSVGLPGTAKSASLINSNIPVTASINRNLLVGSNPAQPNGAQRLQASFDRANVAGAQNDDKVSDPDDPTKKAQKRMKFIRSIYTFNYSECIVIFLLMLNSIIYPNYVSSAYFIFSLAMVSMMMTREHSVVKTKFYVSIFMIIIPTVIFATKCVLVFLMLKNRTIPEMNDQDILFYKSFGIYIIKNQQTVDQFMSFFFDTSEAFLSIVITCIYRQQYNDVQTRRYGIDENSSKLLHPIFDRHLDRLCQLAMLALVIETIFVQTIIQGFILILLILNVGIWAYSVHDERQQFRYLILTFSQGLLFLQLIVTFVLQIPELQYQVFVTDYAMVLDMFGVLLHNLKQYSIVLHLVAITFAISVIQLYKEVRMSTIKNGPIIFPEDEVLLQHDGNKSDYTVNQAKKKSNRGQTVIGSKQRQTSVVNRIRDKTMGVKNRLQGHMLHDDQESIHHVATKYYTHFSPQIWLWLSRFAMFIWAYAYHDFQSWFMLMWVMHSTLFKSTRRFIRISITYYLPIFLLIFMFYYFINIPRVVEFASFGDPDRYDPNVDRWRTYGFFQFSVPSVEVALMICALIPFFILTKCRQQLEENSKEDTKMAFLQKLTDENAPTVYYILFVILNNLDLLAFVTIFFSGVNKIDFYHIFLMFFFVAYILWPKCFIRNYIVLLVYVDFFVFEKYLYTLIIRYIDQDSLFAKIATVLGLATEYDDVSSNKYFKYPPKFQQWLLIIVVFLQFQVHQILKDEQLINKSTIRARDSFKKRYPRLFHLWEIIQHLKKEFLILLSFTIFFMLIILTTKSIINWGFQIILCIFIITYIGVGNATPRGSGIRRLSKVWFMIIWYSSIVLILQITYQFATLPLIRKALQIDVLLDMLPLWIRKNIGIIGFSIYSTYIWEKFLIYLIYFGVGVYVRKQMLVWEFLEKVKQAQENIGINVSLNSDMQQRYSENNQIITNWVEEYNKVRFTTPYLVYKLKSIWIVLDQFSQSLFVLISVMIMVLSNYWQISLSMAIHLTCFICLCLAIASALYKNRKKEKLKLSKKNENNEKVEQLLDQEKMGRHWTEYKKTVNELQVGVRQKVWLFQFIVTLLCMVIIYPTEFIYQIRQTFIDEQREDIVRILEFIIFYMFWGGVYHSPYEQGGHGYFYNFYGYVIILILLIFEKNGQQWSLDRFGCSNKMIAWFKQIEEEIAKLKEKTINISKKKPAGSAPMQQEPDAVVPIMEDEKENESDHSQHQFFGQIIGERDRSNDMSIRLSQKNSLSSHNSPGKLQIEEDQEDQEITQQQLKEELKKWIMKKYRIKMLNGVKILLEDSIQLLLLVSSVYKDSVIGLFLLLGVFIYMIRRKIKQMQRLAWIVGICMILQYGLALSNLTSDNNPMDFPTPFNPYPKDEHDEGQFFIPWYRKIPLLRDNFDWAMYLGMGISNTKLNGLWIDYFIMGFIQVHLMYFGCQLFNIDIKFVKGAIINDNFKKYCETIHGEITDEIKRKESKKLKNEVMMYNIYKYLQASIFMHFHQITIVITLLLAVLARSLFSFGYILVCMIMIYENHKFFRPDQQNFKLQNVLKYWLQPYVFFDLTLQLVYQIPLQFLHRDQDLGIKWCWQNIIGFQDIWIKDANNVDEMVVRNIMFIILKAFTYYFVTLQIQIFDSTSYKKYIKKDFTKYRNMAETKGMSIIWRINNIKIHQIKAQEEENHKINDMLSNLKRILKNWQAQYNLDAAEVTTNDQQSSAYKDQPTGNKQLASDEKSLAQTHKDLIEDLGNTNQGTQKKKLTAITLALGKDNLISNNNKQSIMMSHMSGAASATQPKASIQEQSETGEVFSLDDEELLQKAKNKLGFFANTLIYIKKELTEQIVFISSEKQLKKVATDMQSGKTNIYSKFERKMLSDIRDYRKKVENEHTMPIKDIEIKDMKRTSLMIRFGKLFQAYCQLLIEITATYSDYVCYMFMIISMMKNAGLISLIYPFIVFGYSLLEEINPRKKVWYGILIYTEILILIKFIYQLQFWEAIFWEDQLQHFQDILNAIHVGLQRKASGQFGEMLAYFLPEILILFAIMSHIQKEIMIGLLYLKEDHIETIKEALARYLQENRENILDRLYDYKVKINQSSPQKAQEPASLTLGEGQAPIDKQDKDQYDMADVDNLIGLFYTFDIFNVKFNKDIKKFEKQYPMRRHSSYELEAKLYREAYQELDIDQEHHLGDENFRQLHENYNYDQNHQHHHKIKAASMLDKDELNKIFIELLEQDQYQRKLSMNIVNKAEFSIKRLLYQNAYFEKLFPSFKEQKPGNDMYAIIATFQFLICIFLIFFYTKMDADVTITSDSMTYNQFSGQMVIALFIQILVMIIDRYHYKSKTFISVQEAAQLKKNEKMANLADRQNEGKQAAERKSQKNQNQTERGQSFIQFLRGTSSPIDDNNSDGSPEDKECLDFQERQNIIEKQIVLEKTKITIAIVSKFYLQWILLIFVHGLVFWFFPIHGNIKIQNNANCVGSGACNEFGGNPALIIFYLLYCCYFWVSALQIRYGVPEMKKGNFMMNSYSRVNKFALQGFMAVPFLFELKMFIDWTFTRTALDVFQWFILTATHAELFIARCVQGRYQNKPLGRQIPWFEKVGVGGFGQLFIVLLIAGPLLLFSNFNPISTPNPVTNSLIKLNIVVEPKDSLAKNTINLFTNNYVTQLSAITDYQYSKMQFGNDAKTKSYDESLVQYIKMNNYADANWAASLPNRLQLKNEFENPNSTTNLSISLAYTFDRSNPNAPSASNEVVQPLKIPGMENVLRGFTKIFQLNCDKDKNQSSFLFVPPFFSGVHYLNDKDTAMPDSSKSLKWMKGLRVFYSCENYWKVDQYFNCTTDSKDESICPEGRIPGQNLTGVSFYTFSTKIAPSYFKYSIITFYVSIVLVIGKLFRNVCIIPANRIFIWEIPNSEKLLLLCECIYIYRMRSQLDQEEQLYFTFADIMRSPEMIKAITGSSMKKKTL